MDREEIKKESEDNLQRIVNDGKKYNPTLTSEQVEAYKMGYRCGLNFAEIWFEGHPAKQPNLVHDINFAKTKDLGLMELNELFMACSNLQQVIIKELIYREDGK